MTTKAAFVAIRSLASGNQDLFDRAVKSAARVTQLRLDTDRFKLGSLDAMLSSLDRLAKLEQTCESFLKRLEKMYAELEPSASLASLKMDSKEYGSVSVEKFLLGFSWDEVRFPRSGSLEAQIRTMEERLEGADRGLKARQSSFNAARAETALLERKPGNLASRDPADVVSELLAQGSRAVKPELFVQTRFLASMLVLIPRDRLHEFEAGYEAAHELVVPRSLTLLGELQGWTVAHILVLAKAKDSIGPKLRELWGAVARPVTYDTAAAAGVEERRQTLQSQFALSRNALLSVCAETYKEIFLMVAHVKLLRVIVDGCLRFASLAETSIFVIFFDRSREERLLQALVKAFAEPDKLEFYGTKEQLNDTEDFFPFVYAAFHVALNA